MNKFTYLILSMVVVSVLSASSALAKDKKTEATATQNAAEPKITEGQAKKLVMARYPGANVVSCDMKTIKDQSGWVVKFTRTGGNTAEQVMVDGETGKLTRL